jgi:pilus assembly protein CpaB
MKWAIAGLTVLGIAAAGCAALLVGALRAGSMIQTKQVREAADAEVQVLYAKEALPPMTVIDGNMVAIKTMRKSEAPQHSVSDPVQVVGRILMVGVLPGQPFTSQSFASDSSANIATAVAKGKRAVGISVTDYAGLEGLLYPGSVVDVMVTFKSENSPMNQAALRSPLTTTLLERVQVLAIERQTVVSGSAEKVGSDVESTLRPNNSRRVTLLVDTKQAKALQLAMEQGTLSLSLRNPLDTTDGNKEQISLRSIIGGGEGDAAGGSGGGKPMSAWERMLSMAMGAKPAAAPQQPGAAPAKPEGPQVWETTVIRGDKSQTYAFPVDANGKPLEARPAEANSSKADPFAPNVGGGF